MSENEKPPIVCLSNEILFLYRALSDNTVKQQEQGVRLKRDNKKLKCLKHFSVTDHRKQNETRHSCRAELETSE